MKTETYAGWLCLRSHGEADDILFLAKDPFRDCDDDPLAERLRWVAGKEITVRYWTTDRKCSPDEAAEAFVARVYGGEGAADFISHYSEITGYLWTDEELKKGGHDLLEELKSHVGSYAILQIDWSGKR